MFEMAELAYRRKDTKASVNRGAAKQKVVIRTRARGPIGRSDFLLFLLLLIGVRLALALLY